MLVPQSGTEPVPPASEGQDTGSPGKPQKRMPPASEGQDTGPPGKPQKREFQNATHKRKQIVNI